MLIGQVQTENFGDAQRVCLPDGEKTEQNQRSMDNISRYCAR